METGTSIPPKETCVIGSSTERLKIGVAIDGGGAAISRLNAVGSFPQVVLGTNNDDIVTVNPTSFAPWDNNATELGNSTNRWTTVYATNGVIDTSDRRMKQDIRTLSYGLEEVMQLLPVSHRWKDNLVGVDRLGLIAQEVDEIIPEVVHHGDHPEDMLGLNYAELVAVLIKAIQVQQATIEAQSEQINLQGERIAALETRMTN